MDCQATECGELWGQEAKQKKQSKKKKGGANQKGLDQLLGLNDSQKVTVPKRWFYHTNLAICQHYLSQIYLLLTPKTTLQTVPSSKVVLVTV